MPVGCYLFCDYVQDVCELICTLGLRRPFLPGHPWGTSIGAMMAAEHPEKFVRSGSGRPLCWKTLDAFVTIIPRSWPTTNVRGACSIMMPLKRGLSKEQVERDVYLARHFSPEAITQVRTDNRDWALTCEESFNGYEFPPSARWPILGLADTSRLRSWTTTGGSRLQMFGSTPGWEWGTQCTCLRANASFMG